MADDLRRFVQDLRTLREDRGVSLQRIQTETRIPLDVLRQFEETALEGNRTFNRVYLRSLVRTYAQSIGVPVDGVMQGLDDAFEGRYGGLRADAGRSASPPAPAPVEEPAAETTPPKRTRKGVPPPRAKRDEDVADEVADPVAPDEAESALAEPVAESAEAYSDHGRLVVGPTGGYDPGPTGSVFDTVPERPGLPGWALGILTLLALGVLAGGVFWWLGRTPTPVVPGDDELVAEDTVASRPDSATAALPATLPDTLRLTVRAAGAKLAPFRVVVDQDARRPYWLDADSARVFDFRDSVLVSDLTPTAALLVEGVAVPAALRQPDGSYRIRRADLAASR